MHDDVATLLHREAGLFTAPNKNRGDNGGLYDGVSRASGGHGNRRAEHWTGITPFTKKHHPTQKAAVAGGGSGSGGGAGSGEGMGMCVCGVGVMRALGRAEGGGGTLAHFQVRPTQAFPSTARLKRLFTVVSTSRLFALQVPDPVEHS